VDMGAVRGALRRALHRLADKLVYVVNNDPASFYASADHLTRARAQMSASAELLVAENSPQREGLQSQLLRREFIAAVGMDLETDAFVRIPFCVRASRWPGSGLTPF